MYRYILSAKAKDLTFVLHFLSLWFGNRTRLVDIPPDEFETVLNVFMCTEKAKEGNNVGHS